MRRMKSNPTAKTRKPVNQPVASEDALRQSGAETPERQPRGQGKAERPDVDGAKMVMGVSIAGIATTLLCLGVFFQSDIPTKIVTAKTAHAAQMQAQDDNQRDANLDVYPVGEGQQDVTPGVVADGSAGVLGKDGKDGADGKDGINTPAIVIAPGAVISSEALAGHLQSMTTEDFTELAESVDQVIASDPTSVNLPGRKSLAEAYAEAESKYPGQIDGTKRLKLVDELNAIDYTYYVAEKGDTLLALSKTFDIPLGQLVETNGIHEADEIKAGAILLFPSETVQPD